MANFNYNRIMLAGHLTADVDIKVLNTGTTVATANLAVNRRAKQAEEEKADFFRVCAFNKSAEFFAKYFHKGSSVFVSGWMRITPRDDGNGGKRFYYDVITDDIQFVDSRGSEPEAKVGFTTQNQTPAADISMEPIDDIPF